MGLRLGRPLLNSVHATNNFGVGYVSPAISATGDWRLATGDWRLATGDWRLVTGGGFPALRSFGPEAGDDISSDPPILYPPPLKSRTVEVETD